MLSAQIIFYTFIPLLSTAYNLALVENHICHGGNRELLTDVLNVDDCADRVAKSPLCNGRYFDIGVNGECSCCAKIWLYQDEFEYKEGYNLYSLNANCSLTCPEDMVFTWRDCDGDGLSDPQCWNREGKSTLVRLSTYGCNEITVQDCDQGPACPNITNTPTVHPTSKPSPAPTTGYNCSGPPVEGSIRKNMWMCMKGTFIDPCNNDCFCSDSGAIASGDSCGNCTIDDENRDNFHCNSSWENLGDGGCVGGDSNNISISFYWGWVDDCIIEANRRPDVVAYSTMGDDGMWFQRDYQCLLYTNETTMSGNHTCDWPKYSQITPVGSCDWSKSQEDLDCSSQACTYQASEVIDGFNCYLRTDVYQSQRAIQDSDNTWIIFLILATISGCLLISCYVVSLRRRIKGLEDDFKKHIVSQTLAPGLIPEKIDGLPEIDWKKLEVVKDVGKGSFGKVICVVYRSPATTEKKDIEPGSYVYAVKVMHNVYNEEQRESFKNEIRILQHDLPVNANVVPIIGITKEAGTNNIGIIMPFYELGSLHDHLYDKKKVDRLTFKTIDKLWLILDVATGLNHLHTHKIIHRDIAARNILLFKDMNRINASITDFGMAVFSSDMSEDGRLHTNSDKKNFLGPLKWMAKECLLKNEFTFKSDVYSFAITCWEIMSEKVPWEKMSAKEAARYAFDGGRPPRPEGLDFRSRRISTSIVPVQSRDIRKTNSLKPPTVGSGRQRRLSASSLSISSISHMESFDCASYCERMDHQLQAEIWRIMNECWKPEPEDRPAIDDVQEAIRSIFSTIGAEGEEYDTFADKCGEVESEYVSYNQIAMTKLVSSNSRFEKNKCDGSGRTGNDQSKGMSLDIQSCLGRNQSTSLGRNSESELSNGHC